MICTNCDHELPKGAKFCPECGQEVESAGLSKSTKTKIPGEKTPLFSNTAHAFAFIGAAVVAALIIIFMILDSNRQAIEEKKKISSDASGIPEEIRVLLEKLAADPDSVPLNIEVANLLFDHGQFDQAIPFYQKAIQGDPENIAIQIDMAVCYFNLRQFDQALVEMEKALALDPKHPKGLFNMGIIYFNLKDFDKVREYWNILFEAHPNGMESQKARELMQSLDQ